MTTTTITRDKLITIPKGSYQICAGCHGLVISDTEWLGEDSRGRGRYRVHEECEDCGRVKTYRTAE